MARNKQIIVSAPGKIHFLGEHVVVYGKPALLAAIDKRCTVSISQRKDKLIEIRSINLKNSITVSGLAVLEGTKLAQKKWQEFIKTGNVALLLNLTKDPLSYPILAIGEALLFYKKRLPSGFTLTIDSNIPMGAGLGSSAALAVCVAAALGQFLGETVDKEKVYEIAFRTEQKKHGRPSGGDPATVLHGGLLWFRKESNDLKIMERVPFAIPETISKNFYLVDSGKPIEGTGEMIARVKLFHDQNKLKTHSIFDQQEQLTRELLTAIKNADDKKIMKIMQHGERNLEKLGVVSPFVKKLIREIEKSGGAAKISGGGGIKKGTGMLLVYHKYRKKLEAVLQSQGLSFLQARLGVEGLRIGK